MNKNTCMIAGMALLSGIAVGWIVKPDGAAKAKVETKESGIRNKQKISDSTTRIKTVTTIVTNTVHSTVTNTVEIERRRPQGPAGFMAELERMKNDDPERYASMTNRMAQFRRRMVQRTENKLETLASIDTTGWSKSQIETHEKYQDLIARREELFEIIRPESGASQQEREEAFSELRQIGPDLRETSEKERNTLLDKAFGELGYTNSDAAEIRETIKTIYSTTEEWGGPGPHGPGRRRGGPFR